MVLATMQEVGIIISIFQIRKRRFSKGQRLTQFTQESKTARDHNPRPPTCCCREISKAKEPSLLGQETDKIRAILGHRQQALTPSPTLSLLSGLELVSCPGRSGVRGAAHRQMATLAMAGPTLIAPGLVSTRAEEQRPFMGCNPGRGEKNGQVYGEAGSHGGRERAAQAWLARGPGFRPLSQGGRRSLAASEGPVCALCQQGGQAF